MEFIDNYIFGLPAPALVCVDAAITWIGFSAIVGLVAKGIMFGRVRTGTVATIVLGSFGAVIGLSMARAYTNWMSQVAGGTWREQVLAPATFLVATAGTLALLISYRLLAGRMIDKPDTEGQGS